MDKSSSRIPVSSKANGRSSHWRDGAQSYGWISITLHWLAAILIVTLWFLGDSISFTSEVGQRTARVERHVSLAAVAFFLLALRVMWRLRNGYPRFEGQHRLDRLFSRCMHWIMLASILVMLGSGVILAVTGGQQLNLVIGVELPVLTDITPLLRYLAYKFHSMAATVLLFAIILHVCGACKHLMFDDDDVFVRMLLPDSAD